MKGKIMTTTETINSAPLTPQQSAAEFVKENSLDLIIEELANNHNTIEGQKDQIAMMQSRINLMVKSKEELLSTIKAFLIEHISEGSDADVDDLKQLAEDIDMELTKNIKVTFTVNVECEMEVPLDFDTDQIEEGDFDVSAEFTARYTDVTCDDTSIEIDNFEVEDEE